jgi:integrase
MQKVVGSNPIIRSSRKPRSGGVFCRLEAAKEEAGLDGIEERLSWHALRHSFASTLATDLELPATTLARLTGHADAGFTLRVYARDGRDDAAVVEDLLARAKRAKVGG